MATLSKKEATGWKERARGRGDLRGVQRRAVRTTEEKLQTLITRVFQREVSEPRPGLLEPCCCLQAEEP